MMGRGIYFPFAVPLVLVLIAFFFGNKETSVEIAGGYYTVRPLRLALWFLAIDILVFALLWAAGVVRF